MIKVIRDEKKIDAVSDYVSLVVDANKNSKAFEGLLLLVLMVFQIYVLF